ncbi:PREDICTED: interleukin-1 receptor-like 1 isoform X2 [Sturnus vulgaris]|uniref:interleukin-1 receptor-like 1 isoform X2 n=1 Tax=Sturnus vulgaris TaxID=9172 RepID=UPI00071AADBB|nr:PREDICTED: interleukin-1 receptor-like 1 isoform X2 [Sturnus vulgaris]
MMGHIDLILLSTFLSVSMTSETFDPVEGEALVIRCPKWSSSVKITWYCMDTHKVIPAEEDGSRVFSIEQFLFFLPTSREDSGNYTCVTLLSSNRTKSYNVSVQVHSYKPGACFPSRTHYPNDTGRGRVSCPTIDNYKNATIVQWYKDCKPLQGQRYLKEGKYIYIENPRREDDGYYTCQFIYTHKGNIFNVSATRIFISEVKYSPLPPQIIFPKNKDVVEAELGAALSLKCQARLGIKKQPLAAVRWDVDNIPVESLVFSRFHEETNSFNGHDQVYYEETSLNITEVKKEDLQSNFTCIALNTMYNTRVTVTLQLKVQSEEVLPYALLITGSLVLLGAIAISVILYQSFRVDIVLLYREIFQPHPVKDDGKIYDAYVIYPKNHASEANFVEYFVYQVMPDILENKCGYKLCIYGRDIYPGEGMKPKLLHFLFHISESSALGQVSFIFDVLLFWKVVKGLPGLGRLPGKNKGKEKLQKLLSQTIPRSSKELQEFTNLSVAKIYTTCSGLAAPSKGKKGTYGAG